MIEFVTVKDNLLEFLKIHRPDVIDYDAINNNSKFFSLPNGVIDTCLEEMETDKAIKISKEKSKVIFIITDRGERLLIAGGYVKKLLEEKELRQNEVASDTLYKPSVLYRRSKQITVIASSMNALSVISSVLFKRV